MKRLFLGSVSLVAMLSGVSPAQAQGLASADPQPTAFASADPASPSPAAGQVEPPAAAATAAESTDGEIVVTARKRAESIQEVPLAVTALGPALLEQKNIVKIDQIGRLTPSTFMRNSGVISTELNTYIRGIGDRSSEPSQDIPIAISIDGVYLSNTAGSLVDVFDVQQVEVLRGPQGTLQGRNSPAGAVNITTRQPTGEYALKTQVSYENYNYLQIKAFGEAPIVKDILAAKISGFYNHGGNYMYNETTGHRGAGGTFDYGGRIGILFTPTANFKAYLSGDYTHDTSPPGPLRPTPHSGTIPPVVAGGIAEPSPRVCTLYGFCTPYPKYHYGSNFMRPQRGNIGGLALNANWDVGPVTLTSVSGYRYVDQLTNLDDDALPATVLNVLNRRVKVNSYSEELRAASNGHGRLSYVFGLYGLHSNFGYTRSTQLGGAIAGLPPTVLIPATALRNQKTDSYAVFGQGSFKITDQWSVSAGARQSWDQKDLIATPTLTSGTGEFKAKFSRLTVEAGTEFRFRPGTMLYLRFSQGYRAGGLNGQATSLAGVTTYRPETVNAYEGGLKSEWLDRRLTANFTVFHYDYRDLQVGAVQPIGTGFQTILVNARGLTINGAEFETNARIGDNLTINGNIAYLHTKYLPQILNFGAGATQLADLKKDSSPKFTGYLGFDYTLPLSNGARFDLASSVSYRGTETLNPLPNFNAVQRRYALVDATLTYHSADRKLSIAIFGQNLTNQYYKVNGDTGTNIFEWDIVGRPRTYGVRFTKDF